MQNGPEMTQGNRKEELSFKWFGVLVEVECDRPGLARWIRSRWADVPIGAPTRSVRRYRIAIDALDGPVLHGPGGVRRLDRAHAALHAYSLFTADLFGVVQGHFLFHASSVCRDRRGIVIAGPTTFGKTTLAVALTTRGFDLLADDVTAVDCATGDLIPSARPLGLRRATLERLDAEQLRAASDAARDVSAEDWAVDPTQWFGGAPEPARPSMVVLLRARSDGRSLRRFPCHELVLAEGGDEVFAELRDLPGVTKVERRADDSRYARVHTESNTALRAWIEDHEDGIVAAFKQVAEPPDFAGPPRLVSIGTFQAAVELCQEMLNRHTGSVLGSMYRGREVLLAADVAGVLRGARCSCLFPGRLDETIDLATAEFEKTAGQARK